MAQASKAVQRGSGSNPWRWLIFGLTAFVFVLFAIILWFAYVDGYASDVGGEPRIVEAEPGEFRRPPEDPGGMPLTNEGSQIAGVYGDDDDESADERLLEPEPPLETTSVDQVTPEQIDGGDAALAGGDTPTGNALEQLETSALADEEGPAIIVEEIGDTADQVAAEASQTVADTSAALAETGEALAGAGEEALNGADAAVTAASDTVSQGEAVPEALQAPEIETERDVTAAPAAPPAPLNATIDTQAAAVSEDEPAVTRAPSSEAPAAPATGSAAEPAATPSEPAPVTSEPAPVIAASLPPGYRVQLAAFRSAEAAGTAWSQFAERYAGELQGLSPTVETIETEAGTFYRLQAGPYDSRADAVASCERIKLLGGDCFIVGPRS
jgi:cell division septation protein DedD